MNLNKRIATEKNLKTKCLTRRFFPKIPNKQVVESSVNCFSELLKRTFAKISNNVFDHGNFNFRFFISITLIIEHVQTIIIYKQGNQTVL